MKDRTSFWRGKTVLVTGTTGFLGGWLVQKLVELDAKVICVVHRPKPLSQFYLTGLDARCLVKNGNVSDFGFLESIFVDHPIEAVFHTAYGGDVNSVLREPLECFRGAVQSTWFLLDIMRQKRPDCVAVISSSDKAYGAQSLPYQESQKLNPIHPYEVAKASQDLAAQSYGKMYGLPVAITRCGNYFGGYDFNFTRLIPGTVQSLARREPPVLRSNGRSTRDFLYIADAVLVQLLLAESLSSNKAIYGEAFNFSYDRPYQAIEIVNNIIEFAGSDLKPVIADATKGEIPDIHLSSQKAVDLLGWKPAYGFLPGLKETVTWYLDFFARQAGTTSRL